MKLLEHEAKKLLRQANIAIPKARLIAKGNTPHLPLPIVIKSQVATGGRGKMGGVVIVEDSDQLDATISRLFALPIKGLLPNVLLAEEKLAIKNEFYVCLLIDSATATMRLVAHRQGGMEVESNGSSEFLNKEISPRRLAETTQQLSDFFGYSPAKLAPFLQNLFNLFVKNDVTLLEINPLILTVNDELVCGDCKMELDDAAGFRHPEWQFETTPANSNFVTLDKEGLVATIANGAGLAMATVDAVALAGMKPANFLDIGGGATTESVLEAFKQIQKFPHIKAIVINIFAGITRCDQIAQAVIEAREKIPTLAPLFIRLAGTNFEEAVALLAAKDIPTLGTLEDCLEAAKGALNE